MLEGSLYSDEQLDRVIEAAGGLPSETLEEYQPTDENARISDDDESPRREGRYRTISRRDALRERLDSALDWWGLRTYQTETRPYTPRDLAKEFGRMEKTAAKLLEVMQVSDDGGARDMPQQFIFDGLGRPASSEARDVGKRERWPGTLNPPTLMIIDRAIKQIQLVKKWAGEAHKETLAIPGNEWPRPSKGECLDDLVESLMWTYSEIFERRPTCVYNTIADEPSGPFLAFVTACLQPIWDAVGAPTQHALHHRMKRAVAIAEPALSRLYGDS